MRFVVRLLEGDRTRPSNLERRDVGAGTGRGAVVGGRLFRAQGIVAVNASCIEVERDQVDVGW